ncbi:MAG: hypothetical protein IME93_03025 [Proteobacteria bacterium]|nr:hypothetical protein [Pseudomonadota bacterium]
MAGDNWGHDWVGFIRSVSSSMKPEKKKRLTKAEIRQGEAEIEEYEATHDKDGELTMSQSELDQRDAGVSDKERM